MSNKEAGNSLPNEFVERVQDYFQKYGKPKLEENQRWRETSIKMPIPPRSLTALD